jgi:transcriptional regulator with XRE-family HTH domain
MVGTMTRGTAAAVRKEWGALLRQTREDKGLTQAALAEQLGIDQASVSRTESGNGSFDTAVRIAKALDVALEVAS